MQWVEAARIGRRPNGEVFAAEVFMQYGKPSALDAAIEKALAGKTVFVRREDAPAVLAALRSEAPSRVGGSKQSGAGGI